MMPTTIEKPKTKSVRKFSTEAARQMFLYGEGDGVRIIEVRELSKKTGASEQTIRMRIPEWQAELEGLLASSTKLAPANILSLPNETLEKHKEDLQFIRKRLDKSKSELEALPELIGELKEMVRLFAEDREYFDQALTLMDRTLRLWANEKALTKLFIDLKNLHDSKCGLDSMKAVSEATMKAQSLAALKNEGGEAPAGESGLIPVFKKR